MSPYMTRRYRYSNGKFWLLMSACLTLLTVSSIYHAYSLRNYARQVQAEFRLSLSLLIRTTHAAVITQKRDALQSLADATVSKLQFLKSTPTIDRWLESSFWSFLAKQPLIRAVAVYTDEGDRLLHVGADTPCLSETVAPDGFCVDRGMFAVRLSLPIFTLTGQRDGYISALVMIPPHDIAQAEQDFGLRLNVIAHHAIYTSLTLPTVPDSYQIHAPDMTQHQVSTRASRIWQQGFWLVMVIRLGSAPTDIVVQVAKNADFLIWKAAEAILINSFLLTATAILFSYFHVNYRYISNVYRSVIDGMADWLAFKDTTGAYQIINTIMARELFDLHPKEVVGRRDADLLTSDIAQQCVDSDREVFEHHDPIHLREVGETAAGRMVVLDVLKTPMYHSTGKFGGVILCARDITEQDHLQHTLAELEDSYFSSEWILAKMLQSLPEFVFVKDLQHRFIRASDSIAAFHGLPDVLGKTDFDLHPQDLATEFWREEERLLQGEIDSYTRDERAVAPDGTTRHILTTKMIIRDKRGAIAGLMGIGRDVSELMDKQTAMEYVIAQMTQQTLQQVEQMKKRQTDAIQES